MEPIVYNILPHVSGDSWRGISSITITINGVAPTVALNRVKMQFRKSAGGSVFLTLDSDEETITIESGTVSGDSWVISIPPSIISIPSGTYIYDMQTTNSFGDVKTYMKGSWEIKEDITR